MFSSVTFSVLSAVLPVVFAQGGPGSSGPGSFVQDLVDHLNTLGNTEAANALTRANNTSNGQQWLSQAQIGNFTVFVPTNAAFQNLSSTVSSNDDLVSEYLSYHFVHGDFLNTTNSSTGGGGGGGTTSFSASESFSTSSSSSAARVLAWYKRQDDGSGASDGSGGLLSDIYPNITIARSLLNSSDLVQLEGNKSQVLAWTKLDPAGNVTLLNQENISVTNSSTFQNLFINTIDGVIIPPSNLTSALNATNSTSFLNITQQTTEVGPDGTNTTVLDLLQNERGFTLFVPSNDAIEAQQVVSQFQNNQTALVALLGNHIINGTTIYSPDLRNATASGSSANFTTAAGEPLSVSSNSSGLFLQNQNGSTAAITRPDVLLQNGVFHIIDHVLVETDTNPAQASSAVLSASSVASALSSTDSLPIGGGFATLTSSGVTQSSTSTEPSSTSETTTSATSTPTQLLRNRRLPNDSSKITGSPLAVTVLGVMLWMFAL